jgi:hypothetical protein
VALLKPYGKASLRCSNLFIGEPLKPIHKAQTDGVNYLAYYPCGDVVSELLTQKYIGNSVLLEMQVLDKFSKFLIVISLALIIFGCGSGAPNAAPVQEPVVVYQYGDSITRQAGTTLLDYLPVGSTVVNMGLDGQKASDATNGRYGSMPIFEKDKIYTFSWGVNEALNGFSDLDYELPMNYVFNACKGYKCVIEAPWLMLNPQNNAPDAVIRYRAILKRLGAQYNIPVVFEDSQEHIGEGIHLTEAHMRIRAGLLAAEILKL